MTPSTPSRPDPRVVARLPHIFVDRSLGAIQVPSLLRTAGLTLTTMREQFGETRAQHVSDEEWIRLTALRGWIAFHKDASIRRNQVERQVVIDARARMFCVPRADITADDLARRYISNLAAIAHAAESAGLFIYVVKRHEITRLV